MRVQWVYMSLWAWGSSLSVTLASALNLGHLCSTGSQPKFGNCRMTLHPRQLRRARLSHAPFQDSAVHWHFPNGFILIQWFFHWQLIRNGCDTITRVLFYWYQCTGSCDITWLGSPQISPGVAATNHHFYFCCWREGVCWWTRVRMSANLRGSIQRPGPGPTSTQWSRDCQDWAEVVADPPWQLQHYTVTFNFRLTVTTRLDDTVLPGAPAAPQHLHTAQCDKLLEFLPVIKILSIIIHR